MYEGSHKASILSILNRDRGEEDSYCDITLEVDGQKFPAHKCILGKLSPFFHKMFKTEMKEKYSSSAFLKQIKSESMKTILDFMYNATLEITEENVMEILKVSDYLQISEIKLFCVHFLTKSIDKSNCLQFHALGRTFDAQILIEAAIKIIVINFKNVSKKQEFKELDKKDLLVIMQAVKKKSSLIKSLYTAVMIWVKYDLDTRKEHLFDLLKVVKLHLLPKSYLEDIVANEVLVKNSNDCLQYFVSELLQRLKKENISDHDSHSSNSDSSSAVEEDFLLSESASVSHYVNAPTKPSPYGRKIVYDPSFLASFRLSDEAQKRPVDLPVVEEVMTELLSGSIDASTSVSYNSSNKNKDRRGQKSNNARGRNAHFQVRQSRWRQRQPDSNF